MSHLPAWRIASTLAALVYLAPSGLGAERDRFSGQVAVTVVEIPVQVLRGGEPMRGLTAADFRVFEGEVERPIVGFDVLDLSEEASAAAATPSRPPPVRGREIVRPDPDQRRRHLLLLFDFEFSTLRPLQRAVRGTRLMVEEQLHPTDRVAVSVYTGTSGVIMLQGFTGNRELLRVALDAVSAAVDRKRKVMLAKLEELETLQAAESPDVEERSFRQLVRAIGASGAIALRGLGSGVPAGEALAGAPVGGLGGFVTADPNSLNLVANRVGATDNMFTEPLVSRVRALGLDLADLATLLRGVPEPKHMLYLSSGFPSALLNDGRTQTRVLERLEPFLDRFRTTGWILQAIDIDGLPVGAPGWSGDVEVSPEDYADSSAAAELGIPPSRESDGYSADSLLYMADGTGGELAENYGEVGAATQRVLDRTSVTYVLVIQPDDLEANGRFHPLQVRLQDDVRGVQILHRPGYHAPAPDLLPGGLEERMNLAELVLGEEARQDFPLAATAWPAAAGPDGAEVPLMVALRGEDLAIRRREKAATLEIQAYALDGEGGIQDLLTQTITLDLRKVGKVLARGGLHFQGALRLPGGRHDVRVLVLHTESGDVSIARFAVEVPVDGAIGLALTPPLFIGRAEEWISVRQSGSRGGNALGTFEIAGERYTPVIHPQVRSSEEIGVVVDAVLPSSALPILTATVQTRDGGAARGAELRILRRTEPDHTGATRIVASFQAPGMQPGDYQLVFRLKDPSTGFTAHSSAPFTVVAASDAS